jgi:sugar phosphate isomerase/epimerase
MRKKISIGSWAYAFLKVPILLPETCEKLSELGFDGISMGGFKPHANPETYDTEEKRKELSDLLKKYKLEVADFACDLWSIDAVKEPNKWVDLFAVNADFADKMGWKIIRVDSGAPPILPDGMTYDKAQALVADNFKRISKIAQKYGEDVVWEFEPGFIVNEPRNILAMHNAVGEKNFSVLFDTCHGYMSAVKGARHIEPGILPGGIVEFIEMLKDKIGIVHVIDSDGTLNDQGTSTHSPFGQGEIDFDVVIPALLHKANYKGEWWAIDLCECPDAWQETANCKAAVDAINAKFCE